MVNVPRERSGIGYFPLYTPYCLEQFMSGMDRIYYTKPVAQLLTAFRVMNHDTSLVVQC